MSQRLLMESCRMLMLTLTSCRGALSVVVVGSRGDEERRADVCVSPGQRLVRLGVGEHGSASIALFDEGDALCARVRLVRGEVSCAKGSGVRVVVSELGCWYRTA